ncbi:bifunctional glutamate N-acetyltransferase/amino-acid acetyltransferase ArgJ [Oricola thermophila]|uniref:Arginine biosynthesis bifunctional protein ArgJ n=1 Tax=Oricola thermophila TaxID=2742145 RepID=A0A6N1VH08_9HYPH|nr:bifunctional glutamate N-acetyltransferase/amino-acid acetyltransferase ArgJ [Oricola thermophila]QKV20216.1 bifunctional glutamate N-acetyltransferase/amino-acid acetyltransferase ArgJ [Oricola thermophila]
MSGTVSPLAPVSLPEMPVVPGVRIATVKAGIKYKDRVDLLAMLFETGTTVAGVLTRSRCPSAPVELCRENLPGGKARILVVNAGNANAFTGSKGRHTTAVAARSAAEAAGCDEGEVFLSSTGVIGEPLDHSHFERHLNGMAASARADGWVDAARAIMTTDTFPKLVTRRVNLGDATVTINGIAKGAGMIAPDMATMLAYVATDAALSANVLRALLERFTPTTFNAITVDSDTSTSDTLLAFATGQAKDAPAITDPADPRLAEFATAFGDCLHELALMIVRDGEGATKLVRVDVTGAVSDVSAKNIAMAIANSPLVKTAITGEDANWGRVVMAVGKAGEPADRDRLAIWFGDLLVASEGERVPGYSEEEASAYMKNDEIVIRADIGLGDGRFTAWTCNLTKEYVAINGDYRS